MANITGTNGIDNPLNGTAGDDIINGLGGNDTISGGNGVDTIDGGDGDDTVSGGSGNDLIHGGAGNDTLNGLNDDDTIWGDDGNDTINGGSGNDTMTGGLGNDTLVGGTGNDIAVINANAANNIGTWSGSTLTITTADGTDRITQTETLQFNNRSFTFSGNNVVASLAADTASTDEDVEASGNVLSNDINIDGTLSVTSFNNGGAPVAAGGSITGTYGTLTLNTDGTWNYVPASNQQGVESFSYTVTDGAVVQTQTLTITINNINDAPVANATDASGDEDSVITGTVTASDIDNTAGELTYELGEGPSHGSVVLNPDGSFIYTPDEDYFGEDSFTFTASDGDATSEPQSVNLTISAVNDAPVADNQSNSVNEDVTLNGQLTASDVDDAAAALTFSVATQPLHGQLMIQPDGSFSYVPVANYNGVDTFDWTVTDAAGATSSGTYTIFVTAVNDAPVGDAATGSGSEDFAITGFLTASDVDSDQSALTYGYGTMPANGTLVIDNVTGAYTYTPNADFFGTDSFTFVVYDGQALSEPQTISLTVESVNDSPNGSTSTVSGAEDNSISGAVLATDVDNTNGELVYSIGADPEHGTVVFNPDGTYTYTPNADFNGTDSFTWSVEDPDGEGSSGTVNITVNPVNDAPRAPDYDLTGTEDNTVLITIPDNDVDGEAQTVTSVGGQTIAAGQTVTLAEGTVTLQMDGNLLFTPAADYNGSVDFDYVLASGGTPGPGTAFTSSWVLTPGTFQTHAGEDGGGVAITNEADFSSSEMSQFIGGGYVGGVDGAAAKITLTMAAGDVFSIRYQNVHTDGSYPDFAFIAVNGSVVVNTGSVTTPWTTYSYTAQSAGSFTFAFGLMNGGDSVALGDLRLDNALLNGVAIPLTTPGALINPDTDTGHVHIDLSPVNDAPTAADQAFSGTEDTEITGTVNGGADIDSSELTYSLAEGPEGLVLNADGTFSYTPDADINGAVTFTYTVSDGALSSNTATVTLNFAPANDAPTANAGSASGAEDGTIAGTLTGNDIDGDSLSFDLASDPANGTIILDPNGNYIYTPNANFFGEDSFTFVANDGNGTPSAPQTITLTVAPVNDAPMAADSSSAGAEDQLVTGSVQAIEIDSENLTYVLDGGDDALTLNPDGTFSYAAGPDFNGPVTFTYHATDGELSSATVTHTINIAAVNDDPVANATSSSGDEDTDITGVITPPSDIDGDTSFTYAANGQPAHGTVTIDEDGAFTYTPDLNFEGPDSFSYTVSDGNGGTATGTVSITVEGVNDAPVGVDASYSVDEDGTLEDTISATDVDAGDSLTYTLDDDVTSGVLVLNANGSFTYTPDDNFNGTDSFTYTVEDVDGETSTGTITLNVGAVNDAPVGEDDSGSTFEDSAVTIDVLANDHDVDLGDVLSVTHVNGEELTANGVEVYEDEVLLGVVTQGEGGLLFTPASNYNGTATFSYTVSDGALSSTASVSVLIDAQNDAPVSLADEATMAEDTILLGQVPEATDVEGDSYTYSVAETTANGTLEFNPDGSFTYTPNENFHGTDSFSYFATDADDGEPATFTITVESVNDDPDSTASSVTTEEDTPYEGTVLPNVVDPDDNNVFTFSILTEPEHGTVTIDPETGAYTYTPDPDYNGPDSFEWSVDDGFEGSSSNQVTITVGPVNDAPTGASGYAMFAEDTPYSGTLAGADIDGDTLTFAIIAQPSGGTIELNATTGAFTFTPNENFNGWTPFSYQVSDGAEVSEIYTFDLNVMGVNDSPVGDDASNTTNEDTPVTGFADLTDVDGALTYTVGDASNGEVSIDAQTGEYTFTPGLNFNGTATFTVTGTDIGGLSATSEVTVTVAPVNDAPAATDYSNADLLEDFDPITITVPHTDVDGDPVSVTAINGQPITPSTSVTLVDGAVTIGVVTLNEDGDIVFAPAQDYNGPVDFEYTLSEPTPVPAVTWGDFNDGGDLNAIQTFGSLFIEGLPDRLHVETTSANVSASQLADIVGRDPGFADNTYNAAGFKFTVTLEAGDLLDVGQYEQSIYTSGNQQFLFFSNGTDEGTIDMSGGAGQFTASVDGTYTFVFAHIDFDQNDTGDYIHISAVTINGAPLATAGVEGNFEGLTSTGSVHLDIAPVNDSPVGGMVNNTTEEDEPVSGFADIVDVDNDLLVYEVSEASNGEVTIDEVTGEYTYTPNENFHGTDTFVVSAVDPFGEGASSTVTITVTPVNDPPVAADITIADPIDEDSGPLSIFVSQTDVDGDSVGVSAINGQYIDSETPVAVIGGVVSLDDVGQLVFTPNEDFNGDVDFEYTLSDGSLSDSGQVHLVVTPVNDSPEGANSTASGDEDSVITGFAQATDIDGDALTYAIVGDAEDSEGNIVGTVTIDPVTGEYSFTPNANFNGVATFSWSAEDPDGDSASGVVTVTVDPVNDAPAVDAGGAYILGEDDTVTGQASGSDLDGDDVAFALVGDGLPGLTFNPDGSWSFNGLDNPAAQDLNNGQSLTLTFSYVATDGELNSAPTTVSLVISGSNELFVLTEGVDTFGGTAGGDEIHALGDDDVISGGAGDDLIFGDGGDDLLGGAVGNDDLRGGAGNDTLSGGAGDDVLDGGEGDDVLNGGAGTDLVSYASATGPVNANMTTGTVTGGDIGVDSLVSIEGITGSSFDDTLIGNALANVLVGGLGNDLLNGMGGDDAMTGGLGDDTYHVDSLGDVVAEADGEGTDTIVASLNYTLAEGSSIEALSASGSAGLTLTGNSAGQAITGGQGSDLLYGLGGADVLTGGVGNDLLDSGEGADSMTGGSGNDIYVVDDLGDTTVETLNQGTDLVQAWVNATLAANIENLTLMGSAALSGTGNGLANTMTGNGAANILSGEAGNDYLFGLGGDDFLLGGLGIDNLDGGAGIDRMEGGLGNDLYFVDDSADMVVELAGEGVDSVQSSATFILGANLENLTLTGSASVNGTGNEATNIIYGNSAANTLWGMAGGDQIHGGDGNDVIYGGLGNDQMWGDAGADHFMIDNASMILTGARESDTLRDFSVAQGDRIDLSAIDANGNAADGDQAFTFVSAFTRVAGQATLTYSTALDTTQLRLDVNGDGAYDYQLTINGNVTTGVPILTGASAPSDGGWLL